MKKTPVLGIVGPTASGKSALAMCIAKEIPSEIVCMDSMQIYQGMDIGTAKPTPEEQAAVPHHMLDLIPPTASFTVADYAAEAELILQKIWKQGKLPLLVGGTGLYLRTLMQGMPLGGIKSDEGIRAELWNIAEGINGKEYLHAMLQKVDPETAAKLHCNDVRRVVRALEVYKITGAPISSQNDVFEEGSFVFSLIGTSMERELLYERINQRVEKMLANGLWNEVERLLQSGVSPEAQSMKGIGYKELVPVVEGYLPLEEATDLLKRNTRRYAKRQWTWFRNETVAWIDMTASNAVQEGVARAHAFGEAQCSAKEELFI